MTLALANRARWMLLALAALASVAIGYYLFWSPNSRQHRLRLGLGRPSAVFRVKGVVLDQYGKPVPNYEIQIVPFWGGNPAGWRKEREWPILIHSDANGRFAYNSSPILMSGLFVSAFRIKQGDGKFFQSLAGTTGDIFFLSPNKEWWRDARHYSHVPLRYDPSQDFVMHVGRMGPPERLIQFHRDNYRKDAANDMWWSLDVLRGELVQGRVPGSDVQVHVTEFLEYPWRYNRGHGQVEVWTGAGGGVQIAKDEFHCEAPPDGYAPSVALYTRTPEGRWVLPDGRDKEVIDFYFRSRDGQVYGYLKMGVSGSGDHPQDAKARHGGVSVEVVANPRGSRNLDWGNLIKAAHRPELRLPVSLPFHEEFPGLDRSKVKAYYDPERGIVTVEAKPGAVQVKTPLGARYPFTRVSLVNYQFLQGAGEPKEKWLTSQDLSPASQGFSLSIKYSPGDYVDLTIEPTRSDLDESRLHVPIEDLLEK